MTRFTTKTGLWFILTAAILGGRSAQASFHLMQIEQAIGGVCGNTQTQAIQLRMRAAGQTLVSNARLVAFDAAGLNPIILIAFPRTVSNGALGARILIASREFSTVYTTTPDFTLTNLIPDSYLAAGKITFESNTGIVYWSLAWGGSLYTGSNIGSTVNDVDGNFGPAFDGPLPSIADDALQFQGDSGDLSTMNASDYSTTLNGASLTNNLGQSSGVAGCIFSDDFESGDTSMWSGTQ